MTASPTVGATPAASAGTSMARAYDLPAQPMAKALAAFARASGARLAYDSALTRGRKTGALKGTFTREAALDRLLAGSGLVYRIDAIGTVTILDKSAADFLAQSSVQLDEITVEGKAKARAIGQPPPTGTVGQPAAAFAGGQVGSGGRLGFFGNRSVFDTPFTLNTYTSKLIRDQQAASVADVLANDAGVRTAAAPFGVGELFLLRGFPIGENDFAFDGLYGLASVRRPALEGIERVEVLRGPGSLLFGFPPTGTVAGVINLVPKRAPDVPINRVTAEYFSNGNVGTKFDLARRFGEGDAVGVRLNGAYRDGGTPIANQKFRNGVFTVGLDLRTDRFRASVDAGYQDFNVRAPNISFGVLPGFAVPKAPNLTTNIQQPWSYTAAKQAFGLVRAEYDLLPRLTLFGAVGTSRDDERFLYADPTITSTSGNVSTNNFAFPLVYKTTTGEVGVRGIFETNPITHNISLVGNKYAQRIDSAFSFLPSTETTNIYSPIRLPRPDIGDTFGRPRDISRASLTGLTLGDTLAMFNDRIQLVVGGRLQRAETSTLTPSGEQTSSYDKSAATPLAALVVKPWRPLSLYVSYAEGFGFGPTPPTGAVNVAQIFPPTISKQIETGAKVDLDKVGATLAFFRITQPSGILDPVTNVFGLNGEQRNQGVDFNLFGEPIRGVRVLGGASFIDGRLTKTEGGLFDGNVAPGVAKVQINLGGELDLPPWLVPGLTLGGRVIYTSAQFADQANTQTIPAWTRLDLGPRYRFVLSGKPVFARLNVENVTGANYWASAYAGRLTIGSPRVFRLSLSTDL